VHSRRHDVEVEFYAFDVLSSDGEDLRRLPLSMRKTNLARLLARRVDGIYLSDFEQGEIGPDLFRHACLMGLEGMVSKHRESLYRGGRFRHWVKIKNRAHPAFSRVQDHSSGALAVMSATEPRLPGRLRKIDRRHNLPPCRQGALALRGLGLPPKAGALPSIFMASSNARNDSPLFCIDSPAEHLQRRQGHPGLKGTNLPEKAVGVPPG